MPLPNLRIDGDRLWKSLMEMAEIGATPKGGVRRLALTDEDRAGRDLFVAWCEAAGLTVTVDAMGNIFARRPGRDPDRPPVLAGSHLDSQPTGGKFDGAYGVLAALEVVRAMNDAGIETEAPVEIVSWTNEEGSRFAPAMIASGVFGGAFTLEQGLAARDPEGKSIGEELARIGYAGEAPVGGRPVAAYIEPHIEQGPILEAEEKVVGVVTGGQAQRWFEIRLTGQEAHAGPTPMARRKDALVGAARIVEAVNRIGLAHPPEACATVGMLEIRPNSRNVIPGQAFLTVDFRHPDGDTLLAMAGALRREAAAIAEKGGLELEIEEIWHCPMTPFDEGLRRSLRDACERMGYPWRDIISGAGHDAMYVARVASAAMIFVPCRDGISHNEAESAEPAHLEAGCNVLLHAVLDQAGVVEP